MINVIKKSTALFMQNFLDNLIKLEYVFPQTFALEKCIQNRIVPSKDALDMHLSCIGKSNTTLQKVLQKYGHHCETQRVLC